MTDLATPVAPGKIHAAIRNVQAEVQALDRDTAQITGGKANYTYRYVKEGALMNFLRPLLVAQGVATYIDLDVLGTDGNMVRVKAIATFIHQDDGSIASASMVAQATDQGDKAMGKAATSAVRLLLQKTFLVPNEDPDFNDATSSAPHQTQADQAGEQALADVMALAQQKGYAGYAQQEVDAYLKQTGLVTPDVDWLRGLWKTINDAPAPQPTTELPPDPPAQPTPAAAPPQAGYHTADQRAALDKLIVELRGIRGDVDWPAKIEARSQEAYGKPYLFTTPAEADELIERLTATKIQLSTAQPTN